MFEHFFFVLVCHKINRSKELYRTKWGKKVSEKPIEKWLKRRRMNKSAAIFNGTEVNGNAVAIYIF